MSEIKLSQRLTQLVNWIPKGTVLADIGSDHAYLPSYAIQSGVVTKAIAGEVNHGPFESALETVKDLELTPSIEVRKGDGLQILLKGEAETIVIAGMGGALIRSILDQGKDRLTDKTTLILQPNNSEQTLREWLCDNQWEIKEETILEEDGHIYEAMWVRKALQQLDWSQEDVMFGPFLSKRKSSVFIKKWTRELEKWNRIYEGILHHSAGDSEEKQTRLHGIRQRINQIEEVIR